MQNLVTLIDGIPMVDSKVIADAFGKTHRHVMRDIRNLLRDLDGDFGVSSFGLSEYTSLQNKKLPCYMMTRDGFALLAMGFTGKEALAWKVKYIQAFNAMESALLERTSLMQRFNDAVMDMEKDKDVASGAGRMLNLWKEIKQNHETKIGKIKSDLQLFLPFDEPGETVDE